MSPPKFVWIDFETTGLNPKKDLPLCVGLVVTEGLFDVVAKNEWVIGWPKEAVLGRMDDYVKNMHTVNGLLDRVEDAYRDLKVHTIVERAIDVWLTEILGMPSVSMKKKLPALAGSSVHFDKDFAKAWFPDILVHTSYRILDVSSVKLLAQATRPVAEAWLAAQEPGIHTPLKDIEASMYELKHWQKELSK